MDFRELEPKKSNKWKWGGVFVALMLISSIGITGLPPTTISGWYDTIKNTAFNFIVPNKQATKVSSGYLLETGNKNLLQNASFEHTTANTGWTLTSGSFVNDNSPVDGKQNAQITLSAQSLEFYQDSTLYASQFADGVQGLAYMRVRTSVTSTPIYVCPRNVGSFPSILYCVIVNPNGKWGLYKIPFILGATSNGIGITSNSVSITGDVEVDDTFVGAVDLKQDLTPVYSGIVSTSATTNCSWSTTSASYANFAADSDCPAATASGITTAPATKVPGFVLPAGTVGKVHVIASGLFQNATTASAAVAQVRLSDGTSGYSSQQATYGGGVSGAQSVTNVASFAFTITTPLTSATTYQLQGQTTNASNAFTVSSHSNDFTFSVVVTPPTDSFYAAQNSDTDWVSCGHTTSDFTGFGTVTNIETQCKREGGDLLMRGKFQANTATATEARVALKLNGVALTSKNSSSIASVQVAGTFGSSASTTNTPNGLGNTLIEPSVGYITFSGGSTGGLSITKQNGNAIATSTVLSIVARVPVNGWENSNVIIGSFSEVITSPGTGSLKPKLCSFYAINSGPAISQHVGGCAASISRPTTGNYTITWNSNYWSQTPTCALTITGDNTGQNWSATITTNGTSALGFEVAVGGATPTNSNQDTYVICHGVGP